MQSLKNIDLVVACTHKQELQLTGEIIQKIKPKEQKLVVIDVAEPANLSKEEYRKNREFVIRQDAGNAYSKDISYVLGAFSYKKLSLSKGVVFGCFAEAMAMASTIKKDEYISKNWFEVKSSNMESIANVFDNLNIDVPTPKCFGELV